MLVWWTNLNVLPIIQGVGNICFDDFLRFYFVFLGIHRDPKNKSRIQSIDCCYKEAILPENKIRF